MRYFVLQGNDELGPFDEEELRELSEQGHVQQTTYIRTEDRARSGMLSEILPLIASKMIASENTAPSKAAADARELGQSMIATSAFQTVAASTVKVTGHSTGSSTATETSTVLGSSTMAEPFSTAEPGSTADPFLRRDSYTPRQWLPDPDPDPDPDSDSDSDHRTKTDESDHGGSEVNINKGTLIGSIVIAAAGLFFFSIRGKWTFFDGVNLIFHEAGHLILGFMPQFIVALAGTLYQLAIPGLLAFYFHRHEKMFATQFCVMWLGQSLLNVSNYLADARAQVLPLVGGGEHDWTYLLGEMGVLQHDVLIGRILNGIALLIFAAATAWPWLCQWRANLGKEH